MAAVVALDLKGRSDAHTPARSPEEGGTGPGRFRVVAVLRFAIALLVIANLGRLPVLAAGAKDAPILFNDLLVLAVLAAGALAALRGRRLLVDTPAGFALAFAAVGALSTALAIPRFGLSGFQFVFSIAYLLRWLAYFGIYLVAINFLRRSDVPAVWRTVESMVIVFAGFGIIQSLFLPNFAQIIYPDSELYRDWDPQGRRLVSTFLDPNFAGALLLIVILVALARMTFGAEVTRWKVLFWLAALALTVSRGSLLAFVVGAGVILLARGLSRRVLRFAGLSLLLLIPVLPLVFDYAVSYNKFSIDGSALARVVSWIRAIEIFMDHPLIGVGFNTYGFVQEAYGYGEIARASFGLDGGLLFIAVLTGTVGLALYSGILISILLRCRRVWRDVVRSPEDRGLCLGAAAVTVALVVQSIFLNTLLFPFIMEPLWVLWALTFVVRRREEELPADSPSSGARGFGWTLSGSLASHEQ